MVKRLTGSQIWSMEKLENKLIDMREMYQEFQNGVVSFSLKFFEKKPFALLALYFFHASLSWTQTLIMILIVMKRRR